MAAELTYHKNIEIKNKKKLAELEQKLPAFCAVFFVGMAQRGASSRTLVAYAYDMDIFFNYINENVCDNAYEDISDMKLDVLEQVGKFDLENYLEYLAYYQLQ